MPSIMHRALAYPSSHQDMPAPLYSNAPRRYLLESEEQRIAASGLDKGTYASWCTVSADLFMGAMCQRFLGGVGARTGRLRSTPAACVHATPPS